MSEKNIDNPGNTTPLLSRDVWAVQFRTIGVLAQRELQSRFGYNPLGMLLTLAQPLAIIAAMATIRYMLAGDSYHGMGIIPFIASGVLTFQAFRDTASRTMGGVEANKSLLYLPQVSPLDITLGLLCFQFAWWAGLSTVVIFSISLIDDTYAPDDYLSPALVILAAMALGYSLGLLVAALRRYIEVAHVFTQIIMTPMLFLSGVFFVISELPPRIHHFLTWNPVLHLNEAMRASYFRAYTTTTFDPEYVAMWIVGLLVLALAIERVSRSHVRLS